MNTITTWSFSTLPTEVLVLIIEATIHNDVRDVRALVLNHRIYALAGERWVPIARSILTAEPRTVDVEFVTDMIEYNRSYEILCASHSAPEYSIFLRASPPSTELDNVILKITVLHGGTLSITTCKYHVTLVPYGGKYSISSRSFREVRAYGIAVYILDDWAMPSKSIRLMNSMRYLLRKVLPDVSGIIIA